MKTPAVCAALLFAVLCYGGVAAGDRLSSDLRGVQSRAEGEISTTTQELLTTTTTTTDATSTTDPCYRYTQIKIFCIIGINFCISDDDCRDAKICCPFSNCGNRCVPSS